MTNLARTGNNPMRLAAAAGYIAPRPHLTGEEYAARMLGTPIAAKGAACAAAISQSSRPKL
jgi:hypothetical protein